MSSSSRLESRPDLEADFGLSPSIDLDLTTGVGVKRKRPAAPEPKSKPKKRKAEPESEVESGPEAEPETKDDSDAEEDQHAVNKRIILPIARLFLMGSGPANADWLAWMLALRRVRDGKRDDICDALVQGIYELMDLLEKARTKALQLNRRKDVVAGKAPVTPVPAALTATSIDLGFRNLAYATIRVHVDPSTTTHPLLKGYNFTITHWERVDCLCLAGLEGLDVNKTNMHRLTEILMCGIARHADVIYGTADSAPDYILLENQLAGSDKGPPGPKHKKKAKANVKTYAASHILQANCLLHHANRGSTRAPVVSFVSASKKTRDAAVVADMIADLPPIPRAPIGLAEKIKPVHAGATSAGIWTAVPFKVGTVGLVWRVGQGPRAERERAKAAAEAEVEGKRARRTDEASTKPKAKPKALAKAKAKPSRKVLLERGNVADEEW